MDKKIFRSQAISRLTSLSTTAFEELTKGLTGQLIHFFHQKPDLIDQIGGAYLPMKNEIAADFKHLISKFSLKVSYPIKTIQGMGFGLSPAPEGFIWLNEPYEEVSPKWLIIPGLAFGLKGERLGRGGGYYDRYLESNKPAKIALTYSALICDNIPIGQHDVLMDFIITENFCWDVKQQKRI